MFTGIVREIGTIEGVRRAGGIARLTVRAPKTAAHVKPLESVAVHGVCLTATRVGRGVMEFEVVPETGRRTTLGALRPGARVHLEPSMGITDRLHGHFVFGHVDGTGRVLRRRAVRGEQVLWIRVPAALRGLLVPKGAIAINGVSLTVGAAVRGTTCAVHLIPETLRRTALGAIRPGDAVNVEADYLAKLVRANLRGR